MVKKKWDESNEDEEEKSVGVSYGGVVSMAEEDDDVDSVDTTGKQTPESELEDEEEDFEEW